MSKINGKDIGIYASTTENGTKRLAICATTADLDLSVDTVDASSKCDVGGWTNTEVALKSWKLTGEGFSEDAATSSTQMSFRELFNYFANDTTLYWFWQDGTSGTYRAFSGQGIITSLKESANNGEFTTFSFEVSGQGALTNNLG